MFCANHSIPHEGCPNCLIHVEPRRDTSQVTLMTHFGGQQIADLSALTLRDLRGQDSRSACERYPVSQALS